MYLSACNSFEYILSGLSAYWNLLIKVLIVTNFVVSANLLRYDVSDGKVKNMLNKI